MSKFKVGDAVECLVNGKGKVSFIKQDKYPVVVEFKKTNIAADTYSEKGYRLIDNVRPTLTLGTWEVREVLPEPTFEPGQPVWVRGSEQHPWMFRYYAFKDVEGKHNTFVDFHKDGNGIPHNFIKAFDGTDPND